MLSISAIAAARSEPSVKAEGSLNVAVSAGVATEAAGAGDGVAGGFPEDVLVAGAGAAGGAGVWAAAGVGVLGAFAVEAAVDELAGAVFG